MVLPIIKDNNPCLIGKVRAEFGILSNMSPHPIKFGDIIWPRAENLFQALRFDKSHPIRMKLQQTQNPIQAKIIARSFINEAIISPRSEQDVKNMFSILLLKFQQYEDVKKILHSIGERDLIEDCSARANTSGLFWGACKLEIKHSPHLFEQIYFLSALTERTPSQNEALDKLTKFRFLKQGIYWKGYNWLGKLWKKLQVDISKYE